MKPERTKEEILQEKMDPHRFLAPGSYEIVLEAMEEYRRLGTSPEDEILKFQERYCYEDEHGNWGIRGDSGVEYHVIEDLLEYLASQFREPSTEHPFQSIIDNATDSDPEIKRAVEKGFWDMLGTDKATEQSGGTEQEELCREVLKALETSIKFAESENANYVITALDKRMIKDALYGKIK